MMFAIVRPNPADVHPLLEGWIQYEVAVDLFWSSWTRFQRREKRGQSQQFTPVAVGDATLFVEFPVKQMHVKSKNVVGLLAGATHPTETVIYMAHWDYLGVGEPDATGDRIYNGARDNAQGVAALLKLARVFAAEPRPGCSNRVPGGDRRRERIIRLAGTTLTTRFTGLI